MDPMSVLGWLVLVLLALIAGGGLIAYLVFDRRNKRIAERVREDIRQAEARANQNVRLEAAIARDRRERPSLSPAAQAAGTVRDFSARNAAAQRRREEEEEDQRQRRRRDDDAASAATAVFLAAAASAPENAHASSWSGGGGESGGGGASSSWSDSSSSSSCDSGSSDSDSGSCGGGGD